MSRCRSRLVLPDEVAAAADVAGDGHMKTRVAWVGALLSVVVGLVCFTRIAPTRASAQTPAARPPNIVGIFTDDQLARAGRSGAPQK